MKENWELVEIGECCEVIAGQSPPSSTYNKEGNGIPFFQGKADFNYLYPTVRFWCNDPLKISQPNDILFSVRAPVGPTNVNNIEACIGRGLAAIRCKNSTILKYLLYYLRASENRIATLGEGSTFKAITIGTLKKLQIPLPPLDEQKKIAAILDAADDFRQKTKALIAKYNELSKSVFLDMFGDPVINPKGWENTVVENVLSEKIQNGHYAPKEDYVENGIEMVHMSDAFYNIVIPGNLKKVRLDNNLLSKYLLKSTDILISRRSLNYEGAAQPCLVPEYDKPLVYESSLIRLRPNLNIVNTMFLYYFFSNKGAREKYIFKYVTRSTISGINNKGVNSINIYIPPLTLQNEFAERVREIESQKEKAEVAYQKSDELFKALLQKAFKGDLT